MNLDIPKCPVCGNIVDDEIKKCAKEIEMSYSSGDYYASWNCIKGNQRNHFKLYNNWWLSWLFKYHYMVKIVYFESENFNPQSFYIVPESSAPSLTSVMNVL